SDAMSIEELSRLLIDAETLRAAVAAGSLHSDWKTTIANVRKLARETCRVYPDLPEWVRDAVTTLGRAAEIVLAQSDVRWPQDQTLKGACERIRNYLTSNTKGQP